MLFCKLCDPRFSLITDLFIVLEIEKKKFRLSPFQKSGNQTREFGWLKSVKLKTVLSMLYR